MHTHTHTHTHTHVLQEKIHALGIEDEHKLGTYVAGVLSERLAKTAAIKALKNLGSSMS
jgi:hypothetical protein